MANIQINKRARHLWLLILSGGKKGVYVQPFWYEPNKQYPYPSTERVLDGLKIAIDTDKGDVAYLQEIPPRKLPVASFDKGHGSEVDPIVLMAGLEVATRDDEPEDMQTENDGIETITAGEDDGSQTQ